MSVTLANKTESPQVPQGVNTKAKVAPQFVDSRASSIAQLAMQQLMHNSPQSTVGRAAINNVNASAVQQQKIIQRAAPEEESQLKAIPQAAQLVGMDEEEPLQGKFEATRQEEKPNNTGLPNQLKAGIENLSGMSMDHVKVHYNSDKPAQLQAHAYAQGSDIHVAPGQEQHLPHEAWHVVQQAQGRVKPTVQMKGGVNVNDDVGLEAEADVMGEKAVVKATEIDVSKNCGVAKHSPLPVLQRHIKGGISAVYRLLKNQEDYASLMRNGGKKAEGYADALEGMLSNLHKWESAFTPDDIAEALRVNARTAKGVELAKKQVVSGVEEHIDEEVLSGGHSGEKHYGKDEKYQMERMKEEGKAKVTTLEDSARTRKFFTVVKLNVVEDMKSILNAILFDLSEAIKGQTVTRNLIKATTDGFQNKPEAFESYGINVETISVALVTPNTQGPFKVTFKPKLESTGDFPKTEYTKDGGNAVEAPIVMYWGSNSPVILVKTGDDYDSLFDQIEDAVVAPVTAF